MSRYDPVADFHQQVALAVYRARMEEQIRANLAKLDTPPFAADRIWLTFYLAGAPENLGRFAKALAEEGWRNNNGWEGAFLYPKVEADRTASAVIDIAEDIKAR